MYELIGQVAADPLLRRRCGTGSATTAPTTTSTSPTTGSRRWHPLNQSLYVGYKVMLAGLLMISKGDRIAMHSSVETRYPFLDDDVIDFCSGDRPRVQAARA